MATVSTAPDQTALLPFPQPAAKPVALQPSGQRDLRGAEEIAASNSLLDLDQELDSMLDVMQDELEEGGAISENSKAAFEMFCAAFGDKVDRIARFLSVMEARTAYCRKEAGRLQARAKSAENKEKHTKALLMYYLLSRGLVRSRDSETSCASEPCGEVSPWRREHRH